MAGWIIAEVKRGLLIWSGDETGGAFVPGTLLYVGGWWGDEAGDLIADRINRGTIGRRLSLTQADKYHTREGKSWNCQIWYSYRTYNNPATRRNLGARL